MGLTLFDLLAGLVLVASALFGLARGATREVTTLAAFIGAVAAAVLALRFVGPIMQQAIHIGWIANTAAVLLIFLFVYILLRLIGGALTRRVKETRGLSTLDRILGLAIGLARGLIVAGGLALLLDGATPASPRPPWLVRARLYPIAEGVGRELARLAPKTLRPHHEATAEAPP